MTAIPNVDGTGFWVLSYTNNSPNITAYEFDGDGYTGTAVTSVLPSSSLNGYGSLNFSADGTQLLALTNGFGQPSGNSAAKLRLLGFDAATGAITQRFEWAGSSARGTHGYTADFSPSGDYVYFSRIFSGGTLYRYTIAGANTATQIKASEITVGATGTTGGQVKRAPDGRMYVANSGVASLSVVNTPDAVTPGFVAQGFPLAAGSSNRFGLPQMVTGCLPLDFGDAPDSYGTLLGSNGAVHSYKAGLTLGTKWDAESDGQPSAGADGDDLNGSTNDEDGIASPIVVKSGAPTVVDVTATNNTDTEATLASWIDLNGNGTFEPGELQQIAVPANSGTANYALTWPGQASTSQPTYARFRLFEGTVATPSPDGAASGGEVEDHLVAAASFSVQKTASATSVIAGETLGYTVTVTNTGQLDFTSASPASFTDDLSAVLDDAVYNDDATNGAVVAGGVLSWFGALAAGASKTISYSVTVGNPITGDGVLTNAVVPGGEGHCKLAADCVTTTPVQSFSVLKNTTATEVDPGAVVVYTITVTNTGEVGYTAVNPASFSDDLSAVLDDASYDNNADNGASYSDPVLSWSGPLAVGASVTITYSVTVDDPTTGDSILKNTVVTPPGTGGDCLDGTSNLNCTMEVPGRAYTVAKSANKAEVFPGGTVVYTVTVKNTGALDYTAAAPASFTDDLTAVLDDAVYNGDADNGASVTGNILSWSGPLAIGETVEIHYSVTVGARSSGDGTLTNTVTPTTRGGDCDPAGVCTTDTAVQSYSVEKSSDTTMVAPGGTVVYTVTVKNTGTVAYTAAVPASFTDDLSAVLDDASYNGDATNDATVTAGILSWSGALAVGETTTVVYSVTVTDPASGNGVMTNAAIPDDETGGECLVEECPSVVTNVSTFTVAKSASVSTVSPGGTVVYTVTVENTGTVAYTAAAPASFTDDLSAVLDDATYNNDATGGATVTADVLSWSGALAVGETKTVTYSVTVNDPATGNRSLENSVVPEPGTGGSCKTPGGCITTTLVRSFEVVKSSSATTAIAGDTVTYTIVVRNTGLVAYPAATPASFLDNLGGVLDDATYNNDVDNGATVTGNVLSWSGPLALGATVTITYSVTVDSPVRGDHKLVNTVVTPPGTGSVCEAGSLDPDCTTSTPIAGYSTVKSADATNVVPGETVTYTIVVTNTGEVAYTAASPASFTDDLSEVLDDADYNGDATGGAAYSDPVLSWSDALGIGETKTITYSVTIKSPNPGNQKLVNAVVTPPGIGGSCPVGSTDARCISRIPGPMLQVLKSQSASSVLPGGTVEYTIEVTNTGEVDFTVGDPASFSDDLGQLLDDAVYNGDVTGGAVYSAPMLSWSGPLASGDTHTVTYSVTVDSPSTGNHLLDNTVTTPPNLTSNCPALSTDPACATRAALASFSVAKVADAVTGTPGDVITYSVTVTNTGQVDYSAATPASFSDDLAEVLDDAVYNDDATGGATVTNGVLSWEGELAIGQTVTVRYSVTVSSPATGDRRMINAVVPDESVGGHCTDPADCLVTTPVASYSVSKAASAQKIRAGEVVTYTITVSNTGQVEYTDADPASFTDDLGDVLSLARYNGDASGRASFSSPVLSWAGALGIGENLDVTYSVTVGDGVERGVLRNAVVVPPRSGGLCIQGSGNPECTTETDIELPSLPFTGGDFAQGALVSLLLTAGGVGLVLFSRLRRKSSLGEPGRVG